MNNRRYLYMFLMMAFTVILLAGCGTRKDASIEGTASVRPETIQNERTSAEVINDTSSDVKESDSKGKTKTPKQEPQKEKRSSFLNNSQGGVSDKPGNGKSEEGKVKTNLITSDLEYDKLPGCWEELDSGTAEVSAYYGYFGYGNASEDPIAAIYIELFDGEKRYNTENGIRERLQGWHQSDGVKDLSVSNVHKGILEYTYSFITERDEKEYKGYVFEDQGATWEIGFYVDGAINSTEKDKLKSDFSRMIDSCRLVEIEGDVA